MTRHYLHQLIRNVTDIQSSYVHFFLLLVRNFGYYIEFRCAIIRILNFTRTFTAATEPLSVLTLALYRAFLFLLER
jgi:hypothetical protein